MKFDFNCSLNLTISLLLQSTMTYCSVPISFFSHKLEYLLSRSLPFFFEGILWIDNVPIFYLLLNFFSALGEDLSTNIFQIDMFFLYFVIYLSFASCLHTRKVLSRKYVLEFIFLFHWNSFLFHSEELYIFDFSYLNTTVRLSPLNNTMFYHFDPSVLKHELLHLQMRLEYVASAKTFVL